MKHRAPPLFVCHVWDIQDGQPFPSEDIRRRTLAAAEAVAKGRCALPTLIMCELVDLRTDEVLAMLWNDAGRAALALAA